MIFNVRQMRSSDIDRVYAIETDVHIAPWNKEILRDCVLVGYDCKVLEVNNDEGPVLIGYIIARFTNDSYHILNFCIAKSMQSKGYGKELLTKALNDLNKKPGINSVVLEVRPSNTVAVRLYTNAGFKQIDIKKNYYKDFNTKEDAMVLRKIIST